MFARLFAVASLAALAIAGPAPIVARGQCDTGSLNCCKNVSQAKDAGNFFGQDVVAALVGVTGEIAWGCSPISLAAVAGGVKCTSQSVCCSDNKFNGVIQVGCSPVSL